MHFISRSHPLSRRRLFSNAALLGLVAPILRKLDAAAAPAASIPRVIFLFSPNGPVMASGPASGTSETSFALHEWWKPLEPHRDVGNFFANMANTGAGIVEGHGHGLGGQTFSGTGAGGGSEYRQKGKTIDQVIASRLVQAGRQGTTPSVVWGNVSVNDAGGTGEVFHSGQNGFRPETNCSAAWKQLFASFMPNPPTGGMPSVDKRLQRDKSVLDFLVKDCTAMRDGLGAEGMRLLDEHCTTLKQIESNLTKTAQASCSRPTDPGAKDWKNPGNVDAQCNAFFSLMASSLACELTSVIAYQFGAQGSRNALADSYGVPYSSVVDSQDSGPVHHAWTHQSPGADQTKALKTFYTFYSQQVANLVAKLKTTNDAAGKPLIDSTLVIWHSELGGSPQKPDAHRNASVPMVMFGNAQGAFKTGRFYQGAAPTEGGTGYQKAGQDMAKILVSAAQYMGFPDIDTVGATGVKGGFDWLKG